MLTYVVRVWVPDRPGALGLVASRIGAAGGDVVGIDILERGAGQAIDELVVGLPSSDLVELLIAEVNEVDGAAVEEIRLVDNSRPDASVLGLEIAARLVETVGEKQLNVLAHEIYEHFEANWCAVLDLDSLGPLIELGEVPEAAWMGAFVAGSRHLSAEDATGMAPPDVAWAILDRTAVAVVVGRSRMAFRARERTQLALLGRIASAVIDARPIA
jgi:hypothetical protein